MAKKHQAPLTKKVDGHTIVFDRETSLRMGRIRQADTSPELRVRQALTALGHRYRVKNTDLPGSPDVANRSKRWAIFVHGCYWHRHRGCNRTTTPKRNRVFWVEKFRRNEERDARALGELRRLGYSVLVVWECETDSRIRLNELLRATSWEIR